MFTTGETKAERRQQEQQAQGEDRSRHNPSRDDRSATLQRSVTQNRSSVRSNSRTRIAPPQVFVSPAPPPSRPPPQNPRRGHNPFNLEAGKGPSWLANRNVLTPFAEQPRPAPLPPNRPSRTTASSPADLLSEQIGEQGQHGQDQADISLDRADVQDGELLHATLPLRTLQVQGSEESAVALGGSSNEPIAVTRKHSGTSGTTAGSSNAVGASEQAKRSFERGLSKWTARSSVRNSSLASDDPRVARSRSNAVRKSAGSRSPGSSQAQSERTRKGETIRMLVDTGFFPVEKTRSGEVNTGNHSSGSQMYRLNLPPRLSFHGKALPPTPTTGIPRMSPTELLPRSHAPPLAPQAQILGRRMSSGLGRSPLAQISDNRVGGNGKDGEANRRELAAIGEATINGENVPPEVDSTTPTETRIHLRGGSVVTVTPPELSAWRRAVYLHGPIRLPTPAIVPRKNSVASLEPFQEAVDQLYQHTLAIPRRRSDDAVVDDICDFFDDFGFDIISFDHDCLGVSRFDFDETLEFEPETERFCTPPLEASPMEVIVAQEVLNGSSQFQPPFAAPMPPIETEETLRARGIARLSRASAEYANRKVSLTLGKGGRHSQDVLLPPEGSMSEDTHSRPRAGHSTDTDGIPAIPESRGGILVLGKERLKAMSGGPVPEATPKRLSESNSISRRKTRRNPMEKIKKAVASASTIL